MSKPADSHRAPTHQAAPSFDTDLLPQAVLLIDERNVVLNVNRTWSMLYHHDVQETLGRAFVEYLHPKDKHHAQEAIDQAWENGSTCNCVVRVLDGRNTDRWSDIYLQYHDAGDRPCLVASISDISERVGEERLLLAQHRSINSILNDLPGMVYRCRNNPEWPMEYVSEGCVELTGYRAKDIVHSRTLSYGSMIVEEDQETVWEEVQNALREHRRFELVYRIRTARGDTKWVWEKGKGIYSAEGELSGIEGFITDFGRQMLRIQKTEADRGENARGRAGFESRLEEKLGCLAASADLRLVLYCIHLDRYERYMAGAAHRMLLEGQRRIQDTLRSVTGQSDVIFSPQPNRWFVIQLRRAAEVEIESQAELIRDSFLSPLIFDEQQLFVAVSIGCVVVTGGEEVDAGTVIREASRSMNACHEAGGGSIEAVTL